MTTSAVLVGPQALTRHELHPAEGHGHVTLAHAVLGTLAWVGTQREHPEGQLAQRRDVTHRPVDDDPGPAVLHGGGPR